MRSTTKTKRLPDKKRLSKYLIVLPVMIIILTSWAPFYKDNFLPDGGTKTLTGGKMKIKIGNQVFKATLLENTSAKSFKSLLPLTINMIELNGNEKYGELSRSIPASASNPQTIQNGDLMLYGTSTLVLFYKSFSTSYSYTKLGKIDDVTGLVTTLGQGNVSVVFELE